MQDTIEDINENTCAAFALFWNICRSWLPPIIIDDIDKFTIGSGLPPMHPDIMEGHDSDYQITIDKLTFTFSNARLAPPMGLTANNYARCVFIILGAWASQCKCKGSSAMTTPHMSGLSLSQHCATTMTPMVVPFILQIMVFVLQVHQIPS